jgi:RNA polymerase sigma factor (sigma-70 family)
LTDDFLQVYEQHVQSVYGFLAYRTRSSTDAEDLTQLTFERALKAWDRFDPRKASAGTWLLAIARNAYIDFRRRDRSGGLRSIDAGEVGEREMPTHSGPEESLGLGADVAAAVGRLGRHEREALALRFGGDLRGPEIADLLGISVANAQQRLSRALRKLRSELDPDESVAQRSGPGETDRGNDE